MTDFYENLPTEYQKIFDYLTQLGNQAFDDYKKGNYVAAEPNLRKLAELGIPEAEYLLGEMYDKGLGVVQSDRDAFRLYLSAANHGNVGAMNDLAVCYKRGQGCTRSIEKALEWYKRAAEAGLPDAIVNYASNLLQIYLVTRDKTFLIEANKWALEGTRKGIKEASLIINQIQKYWTLEF